MKTKFWNWVDWAKKRPTVIINIIGIAIIVFGAIGYLIYQQNRSIDVLTDWAIQTSAPAQTREIDGKTISVYNPGDSLIFTSKSTKLTEATGTTTRTIVCEATATQPEREIQLDSLPATRPVGNSPKRENAITVPDVSQFAGLPRWCKLVIDITYLDVAGTGRSWSEHAETDRFLVEEASLDPTEARELIKTLTERIDELEKLIPTNEGEISTPPAGATRQSNLPTTPNTTTNNTTTNNTTTNNNTTTPPPADDGFQLSDLPIIGGLFQRTEQ